MVTIHVDIEKLRESLVEFVRENEGKFPYRGAERRFALNRNTVFRVRFQGKTCGVKNAMRFALLLGLPLLEFVEITDGHEVRLEDLY